MEDMLICQFSAPEHGWCHFVIKTPMQSIEIQCSDVWSPFSDMVNWLGKITRGAYPAYFEIDEEGISKGLAIYLKPRGIIHFIVADSYFFDTGNSYDHGEEAPVFISVYLNAAYLAGKMFDALKALSAVSYAPGAWGGGRVPDLSDLETALDNMRRQDRKRPLPFPGE